MEIKKCSRKFCSEADKEKFAINTSYFMVYFLNVQQRTHLDPNSPFLVAVTNNDVMERKKQVLVCGREERKKNTPHSSYIVYKTAFSYTNSEHSNFL